MKSIRSRQEDSAEGDAHRRLDRGAHSAVMRSARWRVASQPSALRNRHPSLVDLLKNREKCRKLQPQLTVSAVTRQEVRAVYLLAVFVTGAGDGGGGGVTGDPGPSDARYAVMATMSSAVRFATTTRISGADAPLRVPC